MDDNVLAAMARWPDVADVYGWLSLSEQGQWRLHPDGDAWHPGRPCRPPFPAGASIESPQIRGFIARNYGCDTRGRWYFQNGPQRVYVRLDAAPYILLTGNTPSALQTHNGLAVGRIDGWWLDDQGRLYAQTDHGPGMISGRDAPAVFEALHTPEGEPLLSTLESLGEASAYPASGLPPGAANGCPPDGSSPGAASAYPAGLPQKPGEAARAVLHVRLASAAAAPLRLCRARDIAERLGFVPCPAP